MDSRRGGLSGAHAWSGDRCPRGKKRELLSGEELRTYDENAAQDLLDAGLRVLGETLGSIRQEEHDGWGRMGYPRT